MKLYRLHRTQKLPLSVNEAWDFFSNPRNLALITPPSLGFKVTSDVPPKMYQGMILTYTVTPLLNYPVRWVTEITHMDEGRMFVDEQRFGPYKFWHHQHIFEETQGGVEITDLIHYALPFGPIGRIAHSLIVKRQLDEIFEFRREYLKEKFGEIAR
jgi:ligand-binding SRPBCC domain-containing protein